MNDTTEATTNALTMVSLKDICAELGIKPAAARRKLRSKLEKSAGDFRWEFVPEQVDEIKALLTAKAEAPAEGGEGGEGGEDGEDGAE